jgi:hypothetical protein
MTSGDDSAARSALLADSREELEHALREELRRVCVVARQAGVGEVVLVAGVEEELSVVG